MAPRLYLVNQLGFSPMLKKYVVDNQVIPKLQEKWDVHEPFSKGAPLFPDLPPESESYAERVRLLSDFAEKVGDLNFDDCDKADCIAALLDGSHACDDGSAVELGYAAGLYTLRQKLQPLLRPRIIALRCDFRGGEPGSPVNLQIMAAIRKTDGEFCTTEEAFYEALDREYHRLTAPDLL